jgi:hypothetical protein
MTITYKTELISPQRAAELLSLNTCNRAISKRQINHYSAAMQAGQWKFNGDSIRLSKDNVILDGQHRLLAVIQSETTQQFVIIDGLESESFHTIDRGKKRTGADSLHMIGEDNEKSLASALRWIYLILHENGLQKNGVPAQTLIDTLDAHPTVRRWTSYHSSRRDLRTWFESYIVAVSTLFAEKYGDEVVERFLIQLETGEGLFRNDPAFELRQRVQGNKASLSKIPKAVLVALAIKAFAAFTSGKKIGVLRYKPSAEPFPKI